MSLSEFVITLPPPTPNGGLHMGHLSGPFLAADVFYKHSRLSGHRCVCMSFSDANQSYVRVTAERQRRDPDELARSWTRDILETLDAYGSDVEDFFYPDVESCNFVRDLFVEMHDKGILHRKSFPFFYSPPRRAFVDEAGVSGYCPRCLAACKCGICEACAFINDAATILSPRETVTGFNSLELRYVDVLVLSLESFRDELILFYKSDRVFRSRYLDLVREALSGPSCDFPVSVPGNWGIPINHPEFPGQVVNAWAELMAHLLWGYGRAAKKLGAQPQVVNFFGFDNSYFYAIVHASLFMAAGRREWLPHAAINNEFYNLEHRKFSTSNNHVIWARDLAERHSPDLIRFYAAFNNPGFEKSNFSEDEMVAVVDHRLAGPWRAVAGRCASLFSIAGGGNGLPSSQMLAAGLAGLNRVGLSYSLERFHLRQASEDLLHLLAFTNDALAASRLQPADAAFLLKCFAQAAFPLMPTFGRKLYGLVAGQSLERYDRGSSAHLATLPLDLFGECRNTSSRQVA